MTPEAILIRAKKSGVNLTAHDGEIKAKGPRESIDTIVEDLRRHKAELLELLTTRVTVEVPNRASVDMAVPSEKVLDFAAEAKRRGLIVRFRLRDSSGKTLDTVSTDMPGPGESVAGLKARLASEFGERLILEP